MKGYCDLEGEESVGSAEKRLKRSERNDQF